MSVSLSSDSLSLVAATLRAAGCVFAEDEAQLLISAAQTPAALATMVGRRAAGLPLEQVVGWAEFCGLRIAVEPGVFVPRRRTGFLTQQAIALARASAARAGRPAVVVDLCCGSGAVGAVLAAALGPVELHACDVDPVAARCARRNLAAAGGQIYLGDLYDALPTTLRGRVDVLVANAPYVPTGEIGLLPPEAREHEPRVALDGGPDGLSVLRRVIAAAPAWLAPAGHVLTESSERQAQRLATLIAGRGLAPSVAVSTELATAVVMGAKPQNKTD